MPNHSGNPLRVVALLVLLSLVNGCAGYYAGWHYAPTREVHLLHVAGVADPVAEVTATLVGVLRPQDDGGARRPRRVHARLEIENRSATTLEFATTQTRLGAAGLPPLVPMEHEPLTVAPSERRRLDLHFSLDEPAATGDAVIADSALDELELTWSLTVAGGECRGRCRFRRASAWNDPYWRDRWYGDPWHRRSWCEPFGGPSWYWHVNRR